MRGLSVAWRGLLYGFFGLRDLVWFFVFGLSRLLAGIGGLCAIVRGRIPGCLGLREGELGWDTVYGVVSLALLVSYKRKIGGCRGMNRSTRT